MTRLLQDRRDRWRILIVCILLNRTSGRTVKRVLPHLFDRWPTAERMSMAVVSDVAECIRMCGLQNRKATHLVVLSRRYLERDWNSVEELPGVGEYASDSWKIIVDGRRDFVPRDSVLKSYLDALKKRE